MQNYTDEQLVRLIKYPHLIGHLAGKDKLTPMHSDWIKYIWDTKHHTSLAAHRGSYKTTAITECGAIRKLALEPDARIAIVKKTYTNAAESVRNIANIMMLPDVYAFLEDMWGKWKFTTLKDGNFTISAKKTKTQQGSMIALGVDSSFTGKHFDYIMIDDTIDLDDRLSESEREHTKVVTNELYSNVIDPGKHIGATGTFWHPHDAWEVMPPPLIYTVNDTGILTPEMVEEKRKYTTPLLWSINYLLTHTSAADQMFLDPHYGIWHEEVDTPVKAHLDAAYDGNHFCALTIMRKLPNNKFNAVGWVFAGNVKDWVPFIAQKLAKYNARSIYMESNADRGYTADTLRMHPAIQRAHVWVEDYDERMKKTEKIGTYAYEVWKDIEWNKPDMTEANGGQAYMEQVVDYLPDQEPDDAPDSLASLCRMAGFSATKSWMNNVWDF